MTCPVCKTKEARRSRQRYVADYFLIVFGVHPWRCLECHARFHARLISLSDSLYVHCPICYDPELKRISAEHVDAPLSFLWRLLHVPAYRCEPCRYNYFSIRPQYSGQKKPVHLGPIEPV